MAQTLSQSNVYQTLLAGVRKTLLEGQKRIEAEHCGDASIAGTRT